MKIYLLEEKNNKYNVYAFVKEGRYYLEGSNVIGMDLLLLLISLWF